MSTKLDLPNLPRRQPRALQHWEQKNFAKLPTAFPYNLLLEAYPQARLRLKGTYMYLLDT